MCYCKKRPNCYSSYTLTGLQASLRGKCKLSNCWCSCWLTEGRRRLQIPSAPRHLHHNALPPFLHLFFFFLPVPEFWFPGSLCSWWEKRLFQRGKWTWWSCSLLHSGRLTADRRHSTAQSQPWQRTRACIYRRCNSVQTPGPSPDWYVWQCQ